LTCLGMTNQEVMALKDAASGTAAHNGQSKVFLHLSTDRNVVIESSASATPMPAANERKNATISILSRLGLTGLTQSRLLDN
jgi:hypothetical protein